MQKEYLVAITDQMKSWQNLDRPGKLFTDLNFNFTRPLHPAERHEAIAHFVEGLSRLEVTNNYAICALNFADPTFLQITLQSLALDRSRALLRLIVEFRQKFPVKPAETLVNIFEMQRA